MRIDRDRPQVTPRRSPWWLRWAASVLLLWMGLLAGCNGVVVHSVTAHVTGYPSAVTPTNAAARTAMADANMKALRWYTAHEGTYHKANGHTPTFPQHCLALSGGGIRSAAFSIGVLKGLAEKGVLAATDAISSVSGGGYALAWYYMKYVEAYAATRPASPPPRPDVFSDASLADVASRAGFITPAHVVTGVVADSVFMPVNLVLNGLWGTHTNTTPARRMYQEQIVTTFMPGHDSARLEALVSEKPCDEVDGSVGGTCNPLTYFRLPLPIINTTVRIDDDRNRHSSYLARTVFEFTPLRFGNDGFTYVQTGTQTYPLSFAEAIAVSGAAADASVLPGSTFQVVGSAANQDLGYFIDNYNEPEIKKWRKILPFPFYLFTDTYRHDIKGTDIYLSDGGHAENLGAYSLVRRLCRQITIVDAEQDGEYQFESYFKLQAALRRDMSVDLSVRAIDAMAKSIEWEAKNRSLTGRWTEVRVPGGASWVTPVAEGSIGWFPVVLDGQTTDLKLAVRYVKLSMDRSLFDGVSAADRDSPAYRNAVAHYGENAVAFFLEKCVREGVIDKDCSFPQAKTTDQSYCPEQFMAYVDLGYNIIKNFYK